MALGISSSLRAQTIETLITNLNTPQTPSEKIITLKEIGNYYQEQRVFTKAIEYFQQAADLEKSQSPKPKHRYYQTLEKIAICYRQKNEYTSAAKTYEEILAFAQQQNDVKLSAKTQQKLVSVCTQNQDFEKALYYNNQLLTFYQQQQNPEETINAYNNLGYLYKKMGEQDKALKSYRAALRFSQNSTQKNAASRANVLTNAGVSYTQIGDFRKAEENFKEALNIWKKNNQPQQEARLYNYLGAANYINAKNNNAINYALKAAEIAALNNDDETLMTSYEILAEAYQQEGDFKASQKYLKLLQKAKERIAENERQAQEKIMATEIAIEKKENELKSLIAEREKQAAALRQSELEKEKKAQELKVKAQQLELLKRDKKIQETALRNQQLAKEKAQQLLALAEQKAIAEKQERLLVEREKEKLLADKQKAEAEASKQKAEAEASKQKAEAERQKKEKEQEKEIRNALLVGGIVIIVLLLTAVIAFINTLKINRKLKSKNAQIAAQKQEIEQKNEEVIAISTDLQEKNQELLTMNEELQQSQEELATQRDFIEDKNRSLEKINKKLSRSEQILSKAYKDLKTSQNTLEQKNRQLEERDRQISSSIKAAETIQNAILPYSQKLQALLPEHFIIYYPKDIVSGDFYWINQIENKIILIVADCTGHGVPGALMTMIGSTLLDKVVRLRGVTSPAQILHQLHEEISIVLRQKETGNNNGMDAVALSYEIQPEAISLTFAGAKNNLRYTLPESPEIQVIKGTRKAIGGQQNEEIDFENHLLQLPRGSTIYVGSDGYEDQNNVKRRRFGSRKLTALLEEHNKEPLTTQKNVLEEALKQHMQGTLQRDDILLMGVKF